MSNPDTKFNKQLTVRRLKRCYFLLKPLLNKETMDQLDEDTKVALIDSYTPLEKWRVPKKEEPKQVVQPISNPTA